MNRFQHKTIAALFSLLFILLSSTLTVAETGNPSEVEKKEKIESTKKSVMEERRKVETIQRAVDKEQQRTGAIIEQKNLILEQQEISDDIQNRALFPRALITLPKTTFEVGEEISFEFSLTNGSRATFLIDSRKFSPTYEVRSEKEKRVILKGKEKTYSFPTETDLIPLRPGKTFGPLSGTSFTLSKEGTYMLRGVYTFMRSENTATTNVWYGTVKSYSVKFQVIGKEKKKKD